MLATGSLGRGCGNSKLTVFCVHVQQLTCRIERLVLLNLKARSLVGRRALRTGTSGRVRKQTRAPHLVKHTASFRIFSINVHNRLHFSDSYLVQVPPLCCHTSILRACGGDVCVCVSACVLTRCRCSNILTTP